MTANVSPGWISRFNSTWMGAMNFTRVILAGVGAGIVSVFTSWLITGALFHKYQRLTPDTWRSEGPAQYAMSSALNVVECVGIALLLGWSSGFPGAHAFGWAGRGLLFGLACWFALLLPATLIQAVYVKLHRGFVVGAAVDTLVLCLLAGAAGAWGVS